MVCNACQVKIGTCIDNKMLGYTQFLLFQKNVAKGKSRCSSHSNIQIRKLFLFINSAIWKKAVITMLVVER